jgi:hypothetical protein
MAHAITQVEVPEVNQPPFYARIHGDIVSQFGTFSEEYHHTDELAPIVFYREPETVPDDFNLLEFFDLRLWTGEVVSPLTIDGFEIWEKFPPTPESRPAPLAAKWQGLGAVPVWFVSWPELQQAVADGQLTMPDLSSMSPLKGTASFYTEHLYPPEAFEVPGIMIDAQGQLQDGTRFRFFTGVTSYEPTCCSPDNQGQFVHIEFRPIPEPSCIALLLVGLIGVSGYRGRHGFRS